MEVNIEIAQSLFKQNKYQETIDTCNEILTTDSHSLEAIKLIAKSFLATRKIEDARLYLNKALNIKPDDFESIKDLGNTYQAIGDSNSAKKHYQQAIAINSSYSPALTNLGNIELSKGNKQEALSLLIKATESEPLLVPAWVNLANGYYQLGKALEAKNACRKAIELNPNLFNSHFLLANILIGQKKLQEAEQPLRKTIELKPDFFQAHLNLAAVLKDLGQLQEAALLTRKAIELNPNLFNSHFLLANILIGQKKLQEAEQPLRKTIELKPDFFQAHYNLGIILKDLGNLQEAELSTRKAIELKPDFFQAHHSLGIILKDLGKLQEAEFSLSKAIEIKPDFAEAHSNLGNLLKDLGNLQEAELSLRKAIEIKPDLANAHSNLGNILNDLGKLKEAELSTRKAIELNPGFAEAHSNLGNILKSQGKSQEAKEEFIEAQRLDPNNLNYCLQNIFCLSPIPFNREQIDIERSNLKVGISGINQNNKIEFKDNIINESIFLLAYQNCDDDKEILEALAESLSNVKGILNKSFNKEIYIKENNTRKSIRLGICSDYLNKGHAVYNWFWNILKDISSSSEIEIIIFEGPDSKNEIDRECINLINGEIIKLPSSSKKGCEVILSKSIDILIYLDIGMSHYTYLLSLSRLALVQVNALGHTNTSGSPNIDYAFSHLGDNFIDNNQYFTERLIRFNRIPINYSIPFSSDRDFKRSDFKLPDDSYLIGLPHSLFKLHPDFDNVLHQILHEIPHSYLILPEGSDKYFTNKLKERWKGNSDLLISRSLFYPRVNLDDFNSMLKIFDIILCPFYYGMGNTLYQSMAVGTPVISLESKRFSSIFTSVVYKQMNIKDPPVAYTTGDYIDICKKLAFDLDYRKRLSEEIFYKSRETLFNDVNIYMEYIQFFYSALEAAKNGSYLPYNWRCPLKKV